jgi:hypothetical protein
LGRLLLDRRHPGQAAHVGAQDQDLRPFEVPRALATHECKCGMWPDLVFRDPFHDPRAD